MISHHDVIRQDLQTDNNLRTKSLIKFQKIVLRLDRGQWNYHEQYLQTRGDGLSGFTRFRY